MDNGQAADNIDPQPKTYKSSLPSFGQRDKHGMNQTPKDLKTSLESASVHAVKKLVDVMTSPDSKAAEVISSASRIITMTHGKDGLRAQDTENIDTAKLVASAISRSRKPSNTTLHVLADEYLKSLEHAPSQQEAQLLHDFADYVQANKESDEKTG